MASAPESPFAAPRPRQVPIGVWDLLEHYLNISSLNLNVTVALVGPIVVALELKVLPANLASEWKYK